MSSEVQVTTGPDVTFCIVYDTVIIKKVCHSQHNATRHVAKTDQKSSKIENQFRENPGPTGGRLYAVGGGDDAWLQCFILCGALR